MLCCAIFIQYGGLGSLYECKFHKATGEWRGLNEVLTREIPDPNWGRTEADDDDDYGDYDMCYGHQPIDSIEDRREATEKRTTPFNCNGTIMRYSDYASERDSSTMRKPHTVDASGSAPSLAHVVYHQISSLMPCSFDINWKTHSIRCGECRALDEAFVVGQQERYKARLAETAKRKRKADKEGATAKLAKLQETAADTNADPRIAELAEWVAKAKKLKIPQLKDLCEMNCLTKTGSKAVLVSKLQKCKFHGGPGICPHCFNSKLVFRYGGKDEDDLLAMPTCVQCHHFRGMG